jgi:N-acetylneuraminic acid mutarotase
MNHRILTTTLCALAGTLLAGAQVPGLINYQGRLTDANGAPVTGSKNFSLSIYDAATGGNLLYTESIGAVTLDANGVYSFQFGSAGTSNSQVTETIATTDASTLVYTKALANAGVVENSLSVTDGTNSWTQSAGNPGVGAAATANTIAGFVIGATITNGGSGYTSPPAVTIVGNGSGAAATAVLTEGVVTGITITSAGSGYTGSATISIAPPVIPFRVEYSGGAITATYSSAPLTGSAITATYRYGANGITGALGGGVEQWMAMSVDGVTQGTRQRVLAVPFAINAHRAELATSMVDGSVTADKLASGAVAAASAREGHVIMTTDPRPDLESDGFARVGFLDLTTSGAGGELAGLAARSSHTAVWTGTEMIVWGGSDGSANLSTGGRYNPVTDTWTTTSTTGVPVARSYHTAVWTGTEIIIWGGSDGSANLSTGGRYNPVTDTWTATSSTGAPVARGHHTAVWTGTEMIVWGGNNGSTNVSTGARYNPVTDTWAAISTIGVPAARRFHTAIWTGTEMMIWGGEFTNIDGSLNTGGRYNPVTNNWVATSTTGAPLPRHFHTAVWTGSEMLVWGGYAVFYDRGWALFDTNSGGRYNPTNDTWSEIPNTGAPIGRSDHTAVWTGTEMMVWGGNTGARYFPTSNRWEKTSDNVSQILRARHTSVWTGNRMVLFGGGSQAPEIITPRQSYLYLKP